MYHVANIHTVLYKLKTCIGQNASLTENIVCFFYSCDFTKTSTVGLEMNCSPQSVTCPVFFLGRSGENNQTVGFEAIDFKSHDNRTMAFLFLKCAMAHMGIKCPTAVPKQAKPWTITIQPYFTVKAQVKILAIQRSFIYIYVCVYIYIYICLYICIYTYMYTFPLTYSCTVLSSWSLGGFGE